MQRRSLLLGATALLGATSLAARAATPATKADALPVLQVWKPTARRGSSVTSTPMTSPKPSPYAP